MCVRGLMSLNLKNLNLDGAMHLETISNINDRPISRLVISIIHLLGEKISGPIGIRRSRRKAMLACGPPHNPIDLLPYEVIAGAALTRDF